MLYVLCYICSHGNDAALQKEPPKHSFCTGGNLVACHFFPNFIKPFRFSLVFWEEEVPEKYEFCKRLVSSTWDQCTLVRKMAAFV